MIRKPWKLPWYALLPWKAMSELARARLLTGRSERSRNCNRFVS